jgi:Uma2 family endonuclease
MAQADSLAITAQEYFQMREGPPYYQLIEGELYMSPSPHWRHQEIALNIAHIIKSYLDTHDIGRVFVAPMDVVLNQTNVYQPDVLYFHRRRNLLGRRAIEGAPDFVVEVLSDSTARMDELKRKIYAQNGVQELWFVDPESKRVEIYHLQKSVDEPAATFSASDSFTSNVFPGLTFLGAKIFHGV